MLKVENASMGMEKCILVNRLEILDQQLEQIVTYCESLAEAGRGTAQSPFLGSPYEGARMLRARIDLQLRMIKNPGTSYGYAASIFPHLHEQIQAYVTLHNGDMLLDGLTFHWQCMPDLLDLEKDISNVCDMTVEDIPGYPNHLDCGFTAEC